MEMEDAIKTKLYKIELYVIPLNANKIENIIQEIDLLDDAVVKLVISDEKSIVWNDGCKFNFIGTSISDYRKEFKK